MLRTLLLIAIALVATKVAQSQQVTKKINSAKLDSLFSAVEANDRAMCSIAIAKNGNILYHREIGYENLATKVHAAPETEYRIGSISKMFTATMIFQLVQENKLTLGTTLAKFFPKIPNAKK